MYKRIILFVMLFLLSVSMCFAEAYQNRDYNFQLEIPDDWRDVKTDNSKFLLSKISIKEEDGKKTMVAVSLVIEREPDVPPKATLKNIDNKKKMEMLNSVANEIKKKFPTSKITYSNFISLGNHEVAIVKADFSDSPLKMTMAAILLDRANYFFECITNDITGKSDDQFYNVLESLKPIY